MIQKLPLILFTLFVLVGCKEPAATNIPASNTLHPIKIHTLDDRILELNVQMAITPKQQQKGLMFRESMPDDEGMLFIFNPPREVGFWMKNTLIPLDMLFIAPGGVVHKIHRGAVPHDLRSIPSDGITHAVLEINSGMSDKLQLIEGAKIIWPNVKSLSQ